MSLWTRTDGDGGKPKYLSDAEKALTFGMDTTEITAGGDNVASVAIVSGGARYKEGQSVTFSGGGGSGADSATTASGKGGNGAVRIIWRGSNVLTRAFPSTNTGDV